MRKSHPLYAKLDIIKLDLDHIGEKTEIGQRSHKVSFGIVTDSHYARKPDFKKLCFSDSLLKMHDFIDHMNQEQVDFVVHLGDLKDEDVIKNEQNTLSYLREIEAEFLGFKGKCFHCVGNHDLDSIKKKQFLENIHNTGIDKDRSYYSFDLKQFHFVVLDTNFDAEGRDHYFKFGGDWQHPFISKKQLLWLKKDLKLSSYPVIIFCHHPLFEYFIDGKKYHIDNYLEVQEILEKSGKAQVVFQGHVHESHAVKINNIHYITIDSMVEMSGIKNNRYSMVEIKDEKILIHHIGPLNSKGKGLSSDAPDKQINFP